MNLYTNKVYSNNGNPDVLNEIPESSVTILDVGCGAGDNAKILTALGKKVTGLTISPIEAKIAKNFCSKVIIDDIESLSKLADEKFDCIILSHICEHLVDPQKVLIKLSYFLNKDGRIIIAVPNIAYYKWRFRLLKGNWTMEETGIFDRTHLHFYSYNSIDALYTNSIFKLKKNIRES